MSLYNALQKRINKGAQPLLAEAGNANAGSTLAAINAAKSGKATGAAAPVAPSLAEQAAASGAATDVQQAANQSSLAAQVTGMAEQQQTAETALNESALTQQMQQGQQQLAAQASAQRENVGSTQRLSRMRMEADEQMKGDAISSKAEETIANLLSNKKITENDIFSSFAQDERELAFRRDAASIEQMGTLLALRDRAYVDELRRVGAQRNLDDELEFSKESARLALGDQLYLYLEKLKWTEADLTDNLKFSEKMAKLDIAQAWAILKMATDANNSAMVMAGATQAASAGIQAYAGSSPSSTPNSDGFAAKPTDFSVTSTTGTNPTFDVTRR